jgi:hypothetical protein
MKRYEIIFYGFLIDDLSKDSYGAVKRTFITVADSPQTAELALYTNLSNNTFTEQITNVKVVDIIEYPLNPNDMKGFIINFEFDKIVVINGKVEYEHHSNQETMRDAFTKQHAELLLYRLLSEERFINIKVNNITEIIKGGNSNEEI